MPRVFLSYRRGDSAGYTGRIHDYLVSVLGDRQVFLDVADIPPGDDYLADLEKEIKSADAVLVVIGQEWLVPVDGKRRIDEPSDPVRWEILTALRNKVKVLPLLVDEAKMPGEADLPPDLHPFARCEAVEVEHALFEECMAKLLRAIGAQTKADLSARRLWWWLAGAAVVLTFSTRLTVSLLPRTASAPLDGAETLFVFLAWMSLLALFRGAAVLVRRLRT